MKLGIIGLPNVGKSTLFNALTNAGAQSANYPFCTIDPNVGIVSVPDERLEVLAEMYHPQKFTPATIEFVDIAGLVKGASKGEGLGNKFLSHIREVDAVLHVVRCFEDANIVHVDGGVNPARDMETINFELIFADMDALDRRCERFRKMAKGDKKHLVQIALLERMKAQLEGGTPIRAMALAEEEKELLRDAEFLTAKPMIYAANLSEADFVGGIEHNAHYQALCAQAKQEGALVLPICAAIEEQLAQMDKEEKQLFLEDLGLDGSALDRLVKTCYATLNQISYLTAGSDEVRAWTITRGTKAPQAAGKIHTDFERGFIRAQVVSFDDLIACGDMNKAKEKGLVRSEGKEYVVADGDIILFRFNV